MNTDTRAQGESASTRHEPLLAQSLLPRLDAYWRAANYRPINQPEIHVPGYMREDTITTPFDMTVYNETDRFYLAMDCIDKLLQIFTTCIYPKQGLRDKLFEPGQYIVANRQDVLEKVGWR